MTDSAGVTKLAALARITIPEERLPKLAEEFDAILAYVGQLEELATTAEGAYLPYGNIFRKDGEPTLSGTWTSAITEQFPDKDGDSLSVKQIISYD